MTTLHYNPHLCHHVWYVQKIDPESKPVREWVYDVPVPGSVVLKRAKEEGITKPIVFPGLNGKAWEEYSRSLRNAENATARRMTADIVNTPRN